MKLIPIIFIVTAFAFPAVSFANPTQTGSTGLINVPSADTLDSGNVCVGVWSNISEKDGTHAVILPATLTLGMGAFWEIYGTYPNLLINGQESNSGRGTVDLGTKLRVWGKRDSTFKLAADTLVQRHLSNDKDIDGVTDIGARLIASLQADKFAFHLYGGYLFAGSSPNPGHESELMVGGGIEYAPTNRSRIIAEVYRTHGPFAFQQNDDSKPMEGSLGFQYFLSPHLTFNAAGAVGLTSTAQDWRATIGFSTCQGIGSYIKPVPALTQGTGDSGAQGKKIARPVKIVPITPLLLKTVLPVTSVSKLEVPVEPGEEEVIIKPYGQIVIPSQQTVSPLALAPKFIPIRPQQAQSGLSRVAKAQKSQAQQQASAATPIGEVRVERPLAQQVSAQQPPGLVPAGAVAVPTPALAQPKQAGAELAATKRSHEVEVGDAGEEVQMVPKSSGDKTGTAADYTLDLIEGVTPLYGLEIKGGTPQLVAVQPSLTQPVAAQPAPKQMEQSQPVQPQPSQVPQKMVVYRKFRFTDGKFEFNMADLSDEVKRSISEAAEHIRNDKNWVYIRIDGHTDSIGSLNYNMDLSLKRAIAVASYLITKEGIDPRRIFVKGMGKTKMISDNSTPEGRRVNRRFEILFLVPKDK